MSELKPCPFCGGEAEIERYTLKPYAACTKCGCSMPDRHQTAEQAIEAWNTRAELGSGTCEPTEDGCCQYCGEDLIRCDMTIGDGGGAVELDPPIYHNYCPNCGAKVVGE